MEAAQNAGAIGVIVVNNQAGDPTSMGGTSGIVTIPAVMVSDVVGAQLRDALNAGNTVNITLQEMGQASDRDGCFDNGVIAHEYGHGISTRLTGGGSNVDCLFNAEQMGEGWSDWFGLMLTMEPGAQPADGRGIGTYASGQPISGHRHPTCGLLHRLCREQLHVWRHQQFTGSLPSPTASASCGAPCFGT